MESVNYTFFKWKGMSYKSWSMITLQENFSDSRQKQLSFLEKSKYSNIP